jgi:ketosteroid isomerase-like protein
MQPTTTQPTTRESVDAFFTRFGAGDLPGLLDLFAEQVDFNVAGAPNVPWAGPRSSKEEIAEFFGLFGTHLTAPEEFVLNTTVIDGEHAVVTGRCVFGVLSTGKKFINDFALHFTVVAGKIVRYHMYENSHAISAAFTA